MGAWYATRNQVKRAIDVVVTAENNAKVDRAIAGATDSIEGQTNRQFYPLYETRKFDWPDEHGRQGPFRVLFGPNECISLDTFTAGGTAIPSNAYFLRNYADRPRPPFTYLEVDLSGGYALAAGTTWQESLVATGLWGYRNDEVLSVATITGNINSSATTLTVTDSSRVDVGNVLRIGTERMLVTDKSWVDSTINTAAPANTASSNDVSVHVSGAGILQNESIMIDSEEMLVLAVTGNLLTVQRAQNGTVLAAHPTVPTDIFVPRTLTVTRGALGTTAASHTLGDAVNLWQPPDLINQLCIAEAINGLLQEDSGWAKTVGAGDNVQNAVGAGLEDLRARVQKTFGRKLRGPYTV